jgi:hypothetical protein
MLKPTLKHGTSDDEFAWILAALRAGADPAELIRDVASEHRGNLKWARRFVDIISARQWLAEAAPLPDILTMIETRRRFDFSNADCRAYAVSILGYIWDEIPWNEKVPVSPRKDARHAAA